MHLPARFGKYELQEFLGGGMSHVYRAVDTVIGRAVAVKILTPDAALDSEAKERFLHEARISGAIQHDHIVTIHDYGEENGLPYIVMEHLRGGDLRDALRRGTAGDVMNRLRIAAEMAAALEYVHSRGVIHRDIKPENVFLEESGRSKLMDFGISKAAGFNLTKAGNTMGTPFYMSPEQVMGVNITPQVDVYSYGIVLYEMFTGERLVTGDSMERLFYAILNGPVETAERRTSPGPVRSDHTLHSEKAGRASTGIRTSAAGSGQHHLRVPRQRYGGGGCAPCGQELRRVHRPHCRRGSRRGRHRRSGCSHAFQ